MQKYRELYNTKTKLQFIVIYIHTHTNTQQMYFIKKCTGFYIAMIYFNMKIIYISHTHICFCEKWGHPIGVMVFILYKLYVLLPYT